MTVAIASGVALRRGAHPARYRSLQTLLLLMVACSIVGSFWLKPSQVERIMAATERGDDFAIRRELQQATQKPSGAGETRTLVDVALTLGDPEIAVAILNRSLAKQPDNLGAMRLLLEVERQRHQMREVARLDERIFAKTGEHDSLREAADIYASQGRIPERIEALRRLNAIGRATAPDITELSRRLADAGHAREACDMAMAWLDKQDASLPSEVVALAAGLSAEVPDRKALAAHLGALIGKLGDVGPLNLLIQTYAERGRPELSSMAGTALGDAMASRPEVALLLAQLEALQGDFARARRRLLALDAQGSLPAGGIPMLVDLDLQAGELGPAAALIGKLTLDQVTEGLPHRLVEAAFARDRLDVLKTVPVGLIASVSPSNGAIIALLQGDRTHAKAYALAALAPGSDLGDLGHAFAPTVRSLGLQRQVVGRLLAEANTAALDDDALELLLELASSSPSDARAVMAVLRRQREKSPKAAGAWALAAIRQGQTGEAERWLRSAGSKLPTAALLELMLHANERNSPALAITAGAALAGRTDLPAGWSADEIRFLSHAAKPLTPERIRKGLQLIGVAATSEDARERVLASITGSRRFLAEIVGVRAADLSADAAAWLEQGSGHERPDVTLARLSLLTAVAPERALGVLGRSWQADVPHLLPLYASALLRNGRSDQTSATLEAGLRQIAPDRQDAVLYEILARVPKPLALPVLRIGAKTGRPDWLAALDDGLNRAGLLDELRATLRARAARPGLDASGRQALASRLVELNDRLGAIAILRAMPVGVRPDDPGVQQLVYLWGPRNSADATDWLRQRALAARPAELPHWLDLLNYIGAARTVIELVEREPGGMASDARIVRSYGSALAVVHQRPQIDLGHAVAATRGSDSLTALAQLAVDVGQEPAAWQAATRAAALFPTDQTTLLLAAQTSAAMHRSADAAGYYTRLLARGRQTPEISVDAAEALLSSRQADTARALLSETLARLPLRTEKVADARLRSRVLVLLHREPEAGALLRVWLDRYPHHAGLEADLLALSESSTSTQ